MWSLLRGQCDFEFYINNFIEQDRLLVSPRELDRPHKYPCLIKAVFIDGDVAGVACVCVEDAQALIKVHKNGGFEF
jgi:hypothetical protein